MIAPEFLDLEEVLEIHALQLDEFGGIAGVRDLLSPDPWRAPSPLVAVAFLSGSIDATEPASGRRGGFEFPVTMLRNSEARAIANQALSTRRSNRPLA